MGNSDSLDPSTLRGQKLTMVTSLLGMILQVGLLNINTGEPSVIPISKRLIDSHG